MKQTIADALARKGYDTLTPVQEAVSAPELTGRDMLVSAQTGSGKTIGFGLAITPTLLGEADTFETADAPLALVIAPTRELAMQVKRELHWLYAEAGAVLASCVGGMDMRDERRSLARGAHVVVATPGRLRDHIMRGSIDLTQVRAVVLDEADEMLDLGFREDLEFILEGTPESRQTLLFSATVPKAIATLATNYQRNAERISTVGAQKQHADIAYRAMQVSPGDGDKAVINVLRFYEAPNAIVFCNTRAMVARLTTRLSNRGFAVVALSGELTQSERSNALQSMRDGRARVCVATDVAARGIDLPNLDLVVHAELPSNHETLLHRSGRTGRAGRKGVSALVVIPSARKKAERLLQGAKLTADWGPAPSAEAVEARDQERLLASDDWHAEIQESEQSAVDQLVRAFTPEQIAAAYLRQYKLRHSAPEELGTVSSEKPKPRGAFGPSVWFSLSEGRNQNASPRHLLPMVCKAGDLGKDDIGAIRIADDESYVEIKAASVDGFLKAIGPKMVIEGTKRLAQLDGTPDVPSFKRPGPAKPGKWEKSDKPKAPHRKGGAQAGSGPIDWDDAPAPRARKPKPEDRKPAAPAKRREERDPDVHAPFEGRKSASPAKSGAKAPYKARDNDGAKPPYKAWDKEGAKPKAGPKAGAKGPKTGPKGAPPPKSKPSSKKNRARAAMLKAVKAGKAPPKQT